MSRIKILIADDHDLVRSGIINLLSSYKEFEVVAEAADGNEAVERTKKFRPDVVIIDLSMPNLSGIDATKIIKQKHPEIKVLVLTMHESEEYLFQMLSSGASGYLLKSAGKEELAAAIRTVFRGERYFSPQMSEMMVTGYLRKAESKRSYASDDDIPLTKREKEILRLIADGLTNQEIGEKLFISPRTVETHRTNIMQKLDIHDVVNLVRYAIEHGMVSKK